MSRARLSVVVAICGAAVLAIEILGTRILGPFYGVSLYLWSALISVTLAALSVGYALGGPMAAIDAVAEMIVSLRQRVLGDACISCALFVPVRREGL